MATAALKLANEYARDRETFDKSELRIKPIGESPSEIHRLVSARNLRGAAARD